MVVRVQPDVSQIDNQIWLSLRELQNEVQRLGDHVWLGSNPPIQILMPVTWTGGRLFFAFGLKAGQSTNVTVDVWKTGATTAVTIVNGDTVSNTGSGADTVFLYIPDYPVEQDWEWLDFTYSGGAKKPCAIGYIGTRR